MKINRHDTIVGFVAGCAQKYGFQIRFLEGKHADVTIYKPLLPEKLINHRPDVVGINQNDALCIGEAKIGSDLKTKRSKTQLLDFVSITKKDPNNLLIIGIPMIDKHILLKALKELGITVNNQIKILEVPETFLLND